MFCGGRRHELVVMVKEDSVMGVVVGRTCINVR